MKYMEECMICLDEKEISNFVFFSCKHKVCNLCFPMLLDYSSNCPMCETTISVDTNVSIDFCKITLCIVGVLGSFMYIVKFIIN
jgi:hypothetical protein